MTSGNCNTHSSLYLYFVLPSLTLCRCPLVFIQTQRDPAQISELPFCLDPSYSVLYPTKSSFFSLPKCQSLYPQLNETAIFFWGFLFARGSSKYPQARSQVDYQACMICLASRTDQIHSCTACCPTSANSHFMVFFFQFLACLQQAG